MADDTIYGSDIDNESGLLPSGDVDLLRSELRDGANDPDFAARDSDVPTFPASDEGTAPPLHPPSEINHRVLKLPPARKSQ